MVERSVLQRFEQSGPLTWLLAACAGWALLVWMAALLGLGNAVAPTPSIAASVALPRAKPANPERVGPLAQYVEAAARPLFTSDRRPRSFLATGADGEAAAGMQNQTLDFILTGVLISPQVRMAFLQPTAGGESVRVREGSSPEGVSAWRLVDVQPRRAIFEGNGGQSTLELRVFGEAGPVTKGMSAGAMPVPVQVSTDAAAVAPQDAADSASNQMSEADRIDSIRKRIEARRAQLNGTAPGGSAATPSSAPTTK
ncbi:MAG: general secretion pathway protein GspN [Pseudomonadota bacterium]|nr:general secretion pathway protein GspN [Pseudomonadota bacterium]MDQ3159998.1 general secretion pathway protein GspN [Pseudomonadota bacterium]